MGLTIAAMIRQLAFNLMLPVLCYRNELLKGFFLLFCLSLSAVSQAVEKVTLGLLAFPPSIRHHPDGEHCLGESVDLTKHILTAYGLDVEALCLSPARIFRLLESGEVDLTINPKSTAAIKGLVHFIEPPFAELKINLYSYENNSNSESKTLSLIRGYDYDGARKSLQEKGYRPVELPNTISAAKLFLIGRSDFLLTYQAPFEYYLGQGLLEAHSTLSAQHLASTKSYYAVSHSSKLKDKIIEALEDFVSNNDIHYFVDYRFSDASNKRVEEAGE